MKWANLISNRLKQQFRKSPFVFCVLVIVQILTCYSFVFFYTNIVDNQRKLIAGQEEMRTIHITANEGEEFEVLEVLRNCPEVQPENVYFAFKGDEGVRYYAWLYPDNQGGIVTGNPIVQSDVENNEKKIVVGVLQLGEKDVLLNKSVGETVATNGTVFEVIGTRNNEENEIPYTTALSLMGMTSLEVFMPAGLSEFQYERLGNHLDALGDVQLPEAYMPQFVSRLVFPVASSILIAVFSIFTFLFLYRYLLERSLREYAILRISGCSSLRGMLTMLMECVTLFTLSYLISIVVYLGVNRHFDVLASLVIYLSFIVLLLLVLLPSLYMFLRRDVRRATMS